MDVIEQIRNEWHDARARLLQTPFFQKLAANQLTLEHYKTLLRETYYNTRDNPHTYALFASRLKGRQADIFQRVQRHAASEYGHHLLALEDLRKLDGDITGIPDGRPLPTTEALSAFAVYQIMQSHPLAYLGYVYHLEMLPAENGPGLIEKLRAIGVPDNAMEFIGEHAEVDLGHTKLMEQNFRDAIHSEDDLKAVLHGVTGTCRLHGVMLQGILDDVDQRVDWNFTWSRPDKTAAPTPKSTQTGDSDKPITLPWN